MKLNHPWDYVAHGIICFVITLLSGIFMKPFHAALMGINTGITIEGTQIEANYRKGWPIRLIIKPDTGWDLLADGIGIGLAILIMIL